MKRWNKDRPGPSGAVYTWAVIMLGAGALGASLVFASWEGAPGIAALCVASAIANLLFLPIPVDSDQTLGPAIAAAGLALFGAPAAALAMAFGCIVGQVLIRRRRLVSGLFNAGQSTLATLAAGLAGYLVDYDIIGWSHAIFSGGIDVSFILGMLGAAVGFVAASATLISWRVTLDRRSSFAGVLGGSLAFSMVMTLVLFTLGAIAALALTRAVPQEAWLLMIPVALVGTSVVLYAANRQAAGELDVAHTVATELARSTTVEEIARVLAAGIDRVLSADILLVYLRAPGQEKPRVAHYRGPGGVELARQMEPDTLSGYALQTLKAVRIGDYDHDPRRSPQSDIVFGRSAVRSALVAPVAAGREVWGTVTVTRGIRHGFTARHERFVTALADQAASAVRALHLQDQARRHSDRLSALQHAGLLTGATLDPDDAGRQLVERAAEMLGAKYAFLALIDAGTHELYGHAAYGTDGAVFTGLRVRTDVERNELRELARAVRERRPVTCDETQVKGSACPSLAALADVRSALAVPLMRQGRPLGALMVAYTEPRTFTETEITTLESAAMQGAVTIEQARQHVATETQLRRMEAMVATFRRLGGATDLHAVFSVVAGGARAVLGADRCLLLLWAGHGPVTQALAAGLSDEFTDAVRQHAATVLSRHVAQAMHPVVVGDMPADPRMGPLRSEARREGVRTGVFVPLRAQGDFVGVLLLAGGVEVATDATPLFEAFGEQVSETVKHAALLAGSERRLHELALLNRLIGSVSASLDLGEIYRTAAAEVADALGIPRVSVYRVEGQVLRLAAQAGATDAPAELAASAGVSGRVVRTGRPEFVTNVRDDPDYLSNNFDVTSLAVVPVLQEGVVAGLLIAEGVAARPVTAQQFEFLVAFAQQLSVTVQNAVFYEEQRRAHDELQVLYEAARAVSGTLDLRTVLDSMVTVTCRAFGYENGTILMVDPETGDLTIEAGYGHREAVVGHRLPAGTGISGRVARSGTPLVIDDVRHDSRYYRLDDRTLAELAVPLIAEGKVLGVFNVESARAGAFGARDLRLLTTLASYAVVAIQNARLFETAQRLAITDGLTELFNHRYLHESLGRVLERSRRDGQPVGVIMLEIDHFKRYNDTYGHQSGDEALRTVAGLLRRGSRPSDIVARYGGDEFMVVLPGAGKTATHETAERLRRAVEAYPLILADEVITTVTLSVGVAAFPQDAGTVDELVEAVDRAQYIAKRSGGNKVHVAHAT